ncbi:hypothetical protein FF38_08274, partial [Lucilia cuprina]
DHQSSIVGTVPQDRHGHNVDTFSVDSQEHNEDVPRTDQHESNAEPPPDDGQVTNGMNSKWERTPRAEGFNYIAWTPTAKSIEYRLRWEFKKEAMIVAACRGLRFTGRDPQYQKDRGPNPDTCLTAHICQSTSGFDGERVNVEKEVPAETTVKYENEKMYLDTSLHQREIVLDGKRYNSPLTSLTAQLNLKTIQHQLIRIREGRDEPLHPHESTEKRVQKFISTVEKHLKEDLHWALEKIRLELNDNFLGYKRGDSDILGTDNHAPRGYRGIIPHRFPKCSPHSTDLDGDALVQIPTASTCYQTFIAPPTNPCNIVGEYLSCGPAEVWSRDLDGLDARIQWGPDFSREIHTKILPARPSLFIPVPDTEKLAMCKEMILNKQYDAIAEYCNLLERQPEQYKIDDGDETSNTTVRRINLVATSLGYPKLRGIRMPLYRTDPLLIRVVHDLTPTVWCTGIDNVLQHEYDMLTRASNTELGLDPFEGHKFLSTSFALNLIYLIAFQVENMKDVLVDKVVDGGSRVCHANLPEVRTNRDCIDTTSNVLVVGAAYDSEACQNADLADIEAHDLQVLVEGAASNGQGACYWPNQSNIRCPHNPNPRPLPKRKSRPLMVFSHARHDTNARYSHDFTKLVGALALQQQKGPGYAVVARDTNPNLATKRYVVASIQHIHTLSLSETLLPRCLYEMIDQNRPAKLYFDLEMKPTGSDTFDERTSSKFIEFIANTLMEFVYLAFNERHRPLVAHACTAKKFSCHVVFETLFFDCSTFSMRFFVACAKLYVANRFYTVEDDLLREMLDHALDVGLVDESVYKRHQLFRFVGHSKLGQNRPLVPFNPQTFQFNEPVEDKITPELFMRFMVSYCPTATYNPSICKVVGRPKWMKMTSNQMRLYLHYYEGTEPNAGILARAVNACTTLFEKYSPQDVSYNKRKMMMGVREQNHLATIPDHPSAVRGDPPRMWDGDRRIFDKHACFLMPNELKDEQVVYCPWCESVTVNKEPNGEWLLDECIGHPSARGHVFLRNNEPRMMIVCFSCRVQTVILPTADDDSAGWLDSERTLLDVDGYLTPELCGLYGRERLFFIDAPMGKGKTTMLGTYLHQRQTERVLIVTFRQALVKFIAEQMTALGLPAVSYLDDSFRWASFNFNRNQRNLFFVVCVDSLRRLPERDKLDSFQTVVIDECQFTLNQLTSDMRPVLDQLENIEALSLILRNAPRCIFMQYGISHACYQTLTDMATKEEGQTVTRKVIKVKGSLQNMLIPMRWMLGSGELASATHFMLNFFGTYGSSKPFMVFCNKKAYAVELACYLMLTAYRLFPDSGLAHRVLLITGDTVGSPDVQAFMANPVRYSNEYDVVVTTSVLQAGVSITSKYVTAFDFLFAGILTNRENIQLTTRLRAYGREDMEPFRYTWLGEGKPGKMNASRLEVEQKMMQDEGLGGREVVKGSGYEFMQYYVRIGAERRSEAADSINRSHFLYVREYRRANQENKRLHKHWAKHFAGFEHVGLSFAELQELPQQELKVTLDDIVSLQTQFDQCMTDGTLQQLCKYDATGPDTESENQVDPIEFTALMKTMYEKTGGNRVMRYIIEDLVEKDKPPQEKLEAVFVLKNLAIREWTVWGKKEHFDPSNLRNEFRKAFEIKNFLFSCNQVRIYSELFEEHLDNPEINNARAIRSVTENKKLTMLLWFLQKLGVIMLRKNRGLEIFPMLDQNQNLESQTLTFGWLTTQGLVDLSFFNMYAKLGRPRFRGANFNKLMEIERKLRNGYPLGRRTRASQSQNQEECQIPSNASLANQMMRDFGLPIVLRSRQKPELKVDKMVGALIGCTCREKPGYKDTMVELCGSLLPPIMKMALRKYRRYSLNIRKQGEEVSEITGLEMNFETRSNSTPLANPSVRKYVEQHSEDFAGVMFDEVLANVDRQQMARERQAEYAQRLTYRHEEQPRPEDLVQHLPEGFSLFPSGIQSTPASRGSNQVNEDSTQASQESNQANESSSPPSEVGDSTTLINPAKPTSHSSSESEDEFPIPSTNSIIADESSNQATQNSTIADESTVADESTIPDQNSTIADGSTIADQNSTIADQSTIPDQSNTPDQSTIADPSSNQGNENSNQASEHSSSESEDDFPIPNNTIADQVTNQASEHSTSESEDNFPIPSTVSTMASRSSNLVTQTSISSINTGDSTTLMNPPKHPSHGSSESDDDFPIPNNTIADQVTNQASEHSTSESEDNFPIPSTVSTMASRSSNLVTQTSISSINTGDSTTLMNPPKHPSHGSSESDDDFPIPNPSSRPAHQSSPQGATKRNPHHDSTTSYISPQRQNPTAHPRTKESSPTKRRA